MHIHSHEITQDNTQAQYLAKVFNSPRIKHSTKVLIWSTKSEVLQPADLPNKGAGPWVLVAPRR
jgi:hypothetical protein